MSSASAPTGANGVGMLSGTTSVHSAHWPLASTIATAFFSARHAAAQTIASCRVRETTVLAATSHTATRQSAPLLSRYLPFGDHATNATAAVCAVGDAPSESSGFVFFTPSSTPSRRSSSSVQPRRSKNVTSFSRPGAASTSPSGRHRAPLVLGASGAVTGATVADITQSPGSTAAAGPEPSAAFSSASASSAFAASDQTVSCPTSSVADRNWPFGSKETDLTHLLRV